MQVYLMVVNNHKFTEKFIKVHCDYSEKTLLSRIINLHKKYVKIQCDHGEKTLLKVEVTFFF